MDVEQFRDFCLSFDGAVEKMPFSGSNDKYNRDILCFYVRERWFCFVNISVFDFCCVKCAPDKAQELQSAYMGITPGWHMNKKHWISIRFDSDVPDRTIRELVCGSYEIVAAKAGKKIKAAHRDPK
ncbi:MAG: MmcQ/YjbR family DNA-binding protein [Alistipes putredinis]|nr:MAG: MmcQ/YjbR family DNA-binding protein [Alistipes putredinis]